MKAEEYYDSEFSNIRELELTEDNGFTQSAMCQFAKDYANHLLQEIIEELPSNWVFLDINCTTGEMNTAKWMREQIKKIIQSKIKSC